MNMKCTAWPSQLQLYRCKYLKIWKKGTVHCEWRRGPGGKLIQPLGDPPPNHLIIDPAQLAAINCSLQYTHTVCSLASYLLSSVCVCDCVCVFACIFVFIRGVLKGGGWQWIREDIAVWQSSVCDCHLWLCLCFYLCLCFHIRGVLEVGSESERTSVSDSLLPSYLLTGEYFTTGSSD